MDTLIVFFMIYSFLFTITFTGRIIYAYIHGPDRETRKKFRKICKWEHRDQIRQETKAIEEHVAKYTEEHNIDWNQYI